MSDPETAETVEISRDALYELKNSATRELFNPEAFTDEAQQALENAVDEAEEVL